MARLWITLSTEWQLQDVQAVLNVIISFLSTLAIWTFAQFCWHKASAPIPGRRSVPVLSLLSVSSLGDVWDVLLLFKARLFTRARSRILSQCLIVLLFSTSAMLSGPIARFCTRRGSTITTRDVPGLLAITEQEQGQQKILSAAVRWNETQAALERAGFPHDRLLDYLPDTSRHWLFREDEWNSTWSASCTFTPDTSIDLYSYPPANESDTDLFTQLPGLRDVFPEKYVNDPAYISNYDLCAFEESPRTFRDLLLFAMAYPNLWRNENAGWDQKLDFSLLAVYMHDVQRPSNAAFDAKTFGEGAISQAAYTRIDCNLERTYSPDGSVRYAYPDVQEARPIVQAYADYHRPKLVERSLASQAISPPSAHDLFRFYQTYLITKDTQHQYTVPRETTVRIPNVQIWVFLLAVIALVAALILVGLAHYLTVWFSRSRIPGLAPIPDTKLSWMIQSVKEAATATGGDVPNALTNSRRVDDMHLDVDQFSAASGASLRRALERTTFGRPASPRALSTGPLLHSDESK